MNKHIHTAMVAIFSSGLTFLATAALTVIFIIQPFQKQAVDKGFASWNVVDNATGKTEFAWNEIDQTVHKANPDMFDKIAEPLPEK